ncbi:MAG TPA: hypothetical protein DC042_17795, partial [Bacteroidales bacterium]|nr:hypothetical protein [Bacteroidales bacterium]
MKNQTKSFTLILLGLLFCGSAFSQTTDFPGWRGPNRDGKVVGFKAPAVWPKELTKVWEQSVGLGDASPSMVKNRIYLVTSQDSIETLICLDAKSGKLIWKTPINHAPKVTGGAASHPGPRSTPGISDGKIF